MIDTRRQWIAELERRSSLIHAYGLAAALKKDTTYVERPPNQPAIYHDADAFSIANSFAHNTIVVESIAALQGKMSDQAIRGLLGELTSRKTYGSFSECCAYKWLGDAGVFFKAQVPMNSAEVVNPNGSTIDGQVTLANGKVANFDVKGFGFVDHKIEILRTRLRDKFPGQSVLFEGDWTISIEMLQDLLDHEGFSNLVTEMQSAGYAKRHTMEFRLQAKQRMTVSTGSTNMMQIAQLNAAYPFRFTSQFGRRHPFVLVFVVHPWFGGQQLHQNFVGMTDAFAKELSTRAFQSFANDPTLVDGIPRADAVKLLSGLVFLDGWPETGTDAPKPQPFCRIYLNGGATHALNLSDFEAFNNAFGAGIVIEQIPESQGVAPFENG